MAKKKVGFIRARGSAGVLVDKDWITIIIALLKDASSEGQRLAKLMLAKTKHGRHIRLLRLIKSQRPTINKMRKTMKVSRRTIFRDLNDLEEYGVGVTIDEEFRYDIESIPAAYKKLV